MPHESGKVDRVDEARELRFQMDDKAIIDLIAAVISARADGDGVLTIAAVRARLAEAKLRVERVEDEEFSALEDLERVSETPRRRLRTEVDAMTADDIATDRALKLYELAWALAKAKGVALKLGVVTFRQLRTRGLTIHYFPASGHLDVWRRYKVLTIDRWRGDLRVTRYVPGEDWEGEPEEAALSAENFA
jgi:hypothetical protein